MGRSVRDQMSECPRSTASSYSSASTPCWTQDLLCLLKVGTPDTPCGEPAAIRFPDTLDGLFPMAEWISDLKGGTVNSLSTVFLEGKFGAVEDLCRAKYGKPIVSTVEPWQSKGGVNTKSQVRVWKWRSATIYIKYPFATIDSGTFAISTDDYYKQQQKAEKDATSRRLKNL